MCGARSRRCARGDLNPGYPTPDDIVDEVLARAYARLREAGYRPADEAKLPAYFVGTPATATPELAEALDNVTKGAK